MDAETRKFVRERANDQCEYCRVRQRYYPDFAFHVEHIVAKQHGGSDDRDNLALACHLCNSRKGPNLSGLDPETDELTRLFNPRTDVWEEQFRLEEDGELVGLTPIGRATAYVLGMNSEIRIRIRREILRFAGD